MLFHIGISSPTSFRRLRLRYFRRVLLTHSRLITTWVHAYQNLHLFNSATMMLYQACTASACLRTFHTPKHLALNLCHSLTKPQTYNHTESLAAKVVTSSKVSGHHRVYFGGGSLMALSHSPKRVLPSSFEDLRISDRP